MSSHVAALIGKIIYYIGQANLNTMNSCSNIKKPDAISEYYFLIDVLRIALIIPRLKTNYLIS